MNLVANKCKSFKTINRVTSLRAKERGKGIQVPEATVHDEHRELCEKLGLINSEIYSHPCWRYQRAVERKPSSTSTE